MRKVAFFSLLLIAGLILSQVGWYLLAELYPRLAIETLTMTALAFIMIHVGEEFEVDKKNLRMYGWDYIVAMTAAAFPWIFCVLYFVFVMSPAELRGHPHLWAESLLQSRFASPTSAGVLFTMLAAAGLSATWVFSKARLLAIFDDLDTILFLVLLQLIIVGIKWQLFAVLGFMGAALWVGWRFQHSLRWPRTWPWVLGYAVLLMLFCLSVSHFSKEIDPKTPIHLEVLLPAFVLGWTLHHTAEAPPARRPKKVRRIRNKPSTRAEEWADTIVAGCFLMLVGLSMPEITGSIGREARPEGYEGVLRSVLEEKNQFPGWGMIVLHVALITVLSNLGKMFPFFCYPERGWRERLALSVSMFPRGEVGAGVLAVSISYGVAGPTVTVAVLSLAVNLAATGLFVVIVKRLLAINYQGLVVKGQGSDKTPRSVSDS